MAKRPNFNLLDADTVSRAEALGLDARLIVEGYMAGEHKSPYHGFAIEFAKHREYVPGDDVRHLDWKALGRTERHYIKQYEQETNFVAHLLLDGSESMTFASDGQSKLDYGRTLAACLAYLVLHQRDAVALGIFDTEMRRYIPRSDNRQTLFSIMSSLAAFEAKGQTNIGQALHTQAQQNPRKGIFIIISDCLDEEDTMLEGIQHLRYVGHEVVLFHLLDPAELTFPFKGFTEFVGLEVDERLQTDPATVRKTYLAELNAFLQKMKESCERNGCHYVQVDTGKPISETLTGYLAFRHRMATA